MGVQGSVAGIEPEDPSHLVYNRLKPMDIRTGSRVRSESVFTPRAVRICKLRAYLILDSFKFMCNSLHALQEPVSGV